MPAPLPPFAFGGDYNPEQWSREVHAEDRDLMRQAGVDLVTLGTTADAGAGLPSGDPGAVVSR